MSSEHKRLKVQGLQHDFGGGRGLSSLDLSVGPGEIVGLLGPNGSGKSTALALLAGMLPLAGAQGHLQLPNGPVGLRSRDYRASLGVVFQHPSLDRKLSAFENLHLSLRSHGWGTQAAAKRCDELLAAEGLGERADDIVDDFSGGMRRRVDLLRALAHRPQLLLMDEPSSGLDERSFRGLWDMLEQLRQREGVSVLVATHRPEEAARCDRLMILAGGKVVATGTPKELVAGLQGDLLVLELSAGSDADAVVSRLRDEFGLEAQAVGKTLQVPCEDGPRRLVQVVELMGQGTFESISVRRPSLADVFFELSGTRLDEDEAAPPSRKGRRRRAPKKERAA